MTLTLEEAEAYAAFVAAFNQFGEEYRRRRLLGLSNNDGIRWQYEPWHWPTRDDEWPCQLCWAVNRWPWEPARGCPITVPVEATYCEKHRLELELGVS